MLGPPWESFCSGFLGKQTLNMVELLLHLGIDMAVDGIGLPLHLRLDSGDLACQLPCDLSLLFMLVLP